MSSCGLPPTLSGYLQFIRNGMGIQVQYLPDDSYWIGATFNIGISLTNRNLKAIAGQPNYPSQYALAVYNLAGHMLIYLASDQDGQTYFQNARDKFKLTSFISGAISSSNDETSGQSLVVPKWAENLTIADLNALQTPWGRNYLGIAQMYGPSGWGLS